MEQANSLFHGTEEIAWFAGGLPPRTIKVQLSAVRSGNANFIGSSANSAGTLAWNTTAVSDGWYELRAVLTDDSGQTLGELSRTVLVNNAAAWHSGWIAGNETWAVGTVNIIEADVTVASGATLTIEPGAIVKFAPGTGIIVQSGGVLNAPATAGSPIILTSLADDTAGGDSNLDGSNSLPEPGDWRGITLQGTGQFNETAFVDVRYALSLHGGVLAGSETWAGTLVHVLPSDVTVPSGATLTVNPGAVVKLASGVSLVVQAGGSLSAQGTVAQPITFTSLKDDSVGGDSNGDGGATTPAAGDWNSIYISSASAALDHVIVRYGGGPDAVQSGLIHSDGSSVVTVSNSRLDQGFYHGIQASGGDMTVRNCVITGCDRGVKANCIVHVINCTLDNNNIGLLVHCNTLDATNTIVANSISSGIQYQLRHTAFTVALRCLVFELIRVSQLQEYPRPDGGEWKYLRRSSI